jgi:hypothetical protein
MEAREYTKMSSSDFNLIMVFNETFDFLIASFSTFLTIVFAFLVASALIGGKLSRTLSGIAIGLFSGASFIFLLLCYNVAANLGVLAEEIKSAVARGESELDWVGFVAADAPVGLGLRGLALLMFLAYVASIVFYLNQRRRSGSPV